jgi:hypothetical protein
MAGLIDGEGAIFIYRALPTPKNGLNRVAHYGAISVSNTNRAVIEWCAGLWPNGHFKERAPRQYGWKPYYQLGWTNRGALVVLNDIIPYLKIKRVQGKLCRTFIQYKMTHTMPRGYHRDESLYAEAKAQIYDTRERMRLAMMKLNVKGSGVHNLSDPTFTWGHYENGKRKAGGT